MEVIVVPAPDPAEQRGRLCRAFLWRFLIASLLIQIIILSINWRYEIFYPLAFLLIVLGLLVYKWQMR